MEVNTEDRTEWAYCKYRIAKKDIIVQKMIVTEKKKDALK
jgi:hypothetical protein